MLTPETAVDRVQSAIARARACGADAADAILVADTALSVSVRLGQLEDVGRSEGVELGLRVFVGQRSASVSTSDLSESGLAALAQRVVAMARAAPEDRWAGLAPADRLLRGAPPLLDLDAGGDVAPPLLREAALAVEDAARSVAGVSNSEGGSAGYSRAVVAFATSHGFAQGYAVTSHGISASVLAGEGAAMQRDHAHHSARHRMMLEAPEIVGRRAGERAVARLNPVKIDGGAMPVVFDTRVGGSMIGYVLGAISGPSIARGTSFLREQLGHAILPEGLSIIDDPHRPHGLRARPFDGEGLPVSPMALVERGVLQTWLLDSASARQLGLEPTGHASRGLGGPPGVTTGNVHLAGGAGSREALIGGIARGVLVTELIGQGVNGVTGDYSRGASGFLIEGGEITRPVSGITIAGNLRPMLASITAAGDLEHRQGVNVPTIRVDGMTVAGG
ncbi:metallopeptidase TldD-related protein [Sphingomonas sp. 2R-10]|uniref:TldD/PmbA family protein n=1 Tax=Sphingomonas sp. 2R-10 TaxID=3045148 RepID=UPI000F7B1FAB|nr:metallopeptidase TldD-related protein [Sphingomonas sp. 2R-10]MDJ0278180.1 metallopeptidase TldD-related protein [Sphingomonas sp. 2R-10]